MERDPFLIELSRISGELLILAQCGCGRVKELRPRIPRKTELRHALGKLQSMLNGVEAQAKRVKSLSASYDGEIRSDGGVH